MDNNTEIKPSSKEPAFSFSNWFKPTSKNIIAYCTAIKSTGFLISGIALKVLISALMVTPIATPLILKSLWFLVGGGVLGIIADLFEKLTKGEPVSVIKFGLEELEKENEQQNGTEQIN